MIVSGHSRNSVCFASDILGSPVFNQIDPRSFAHNSPHDIQLKSCEYTQSSSPTQQLDKIDSRRLTSTSVSSGSVYTDENETEVANFYDIYGASEEHNHRGLEKDLPPLPEFPRRSVGDVHKVAP